MLTKLYVGNLSFRTGETELQAWIEQHGFGVESVQIITDRDTGRSKGFGFAVLLEDWKIQEAIIAMNGKELGGRRLTVNEARPMVRTHAGRLPYRDRD